MTYHSELPYPFVVVDDPAAIAVKILGKIHQLSRPKAYVVWGMSDFKVYKEAELDRLSYIADQPWRIVGLYDRSVDAEQLVGDLKSWLLEEAKVVA